MSIGEWSTWSTPHSQSQQQKEDFSYHKPNNKCNRQQHLDTVSWKQKSKNNKYRGDQMHVRTTSHTGSGPLGGTGRLILVAGPLSFILGAWTFFFSSNEFSELLVFPLPPLSPGLCQCADAFSSRPWEVDLGFPSLGIHLLSSYLEKYALIRL